jgi:tetratricopeptide (TPR) repeat protein
MLGAAMKKLIPGGAIACVALSLVLAACATSVRRGELAAEYYNLGNAYLQIGKNDKAIGFYEKAIRLDPENRRAQFNLALALIDSGKAGEALAVLEGLAGVDPDNLEVLSALAYTYYAAGSREEAVAAYRRLLEKAPGSVDDRYNLGSILSEMGRPHEALDEFLTLLEGAPGDLPALKAAGSLLLELGQYAEASTVLAEYLQEKPDDAAVYLLLARAYRGQERYDKALEAYENALVHNEKLAEAWFESAEILLTKVQDPERGITALEQALSYGFKDPPSIASLLGAPDLLERERVRSLLARHDLLPAQGEGKEEGEGEGS